MSNYFENYQKWLTSDSLSDDEKQELLAIQSDDKEIELRFSSTLSFGI